MKQPPAQGGLGRCLVARLRVGGPLKAEEARDVALQLLEPGVVTRAKDGTAVLAAFARHGLWREALALLHSLRGGAGVDTVLCNACIAVCGKASCWEVAASLLCSMSLYRVSPDVISFGAVLNSLEKVGEWQRSVRLLSEMANAQVKPNVVVFNSAISACQKGNSEEAALALLQTLDSASVEPDVVTFNAALSACRRWAKAKELRSDLRERGLVEDIYTFNSLLSVAERCLRWDVALQLLEEMPSADLAPDVVSFSTTISACEKALRWEMALALLEEMRVRKVAPNAFTFGAAASACEACRQWERAMALLANAGSFSITANSILCGVLLSTCARGACWAMAMEVLQEMQSLQIPATAVAQNAALAALAATGVWRHSLSLISTAKELDSVGLGEVVRSCAVASKWQQVLQLGLETESRWGFSPDAPLIALVTDSALTVGQAGPLPQLRATAQAVLLRLPDARTAARVKQADPAVVLVDVLSEVGVVPTICRAAFGRFRSAAQRGLAAIVAERKAVNVAELLRAPEIEESFSLGADLTASFFASAASWLPMARLATRRASRNSGLVDQAEDLMALAVAAWSEEELCCGGFDVETASPASAPDRKLTGGFRRMPKVLRQILSSSDAVVTGTGKGRNGGMWHANYSDYSWKYQSYQYCCTGNDADGNSSLHIPCTQIKLTRKHSIQHQHSIQHLRQASQRRPPPKSPAQPSWADLSEDLTPPSLNEELPTLLPKPSKGNGKGKGKTAKKSSKGTGKGRNGGKWHGDYSDYSWSHHGCRYCGWH
ncbi:unnamed protein product [Symbiodinium sp. CCMP2592]|nr:unnamed protein product [Symbiodinium sp. CCMP2592]